MASSPGDGGGSDRQYRPNMQGLLQFCADNTSAEDASGPSTAEALDPERREWLQNALLGMAGNDLLKQMAECLKCLEESNSSNDKLQALDTLHEMCEDLDLAQDLPKIGGFNILPRLLRDEDEEIRAKTCSLIGTMVQNNEYCQHEAVQCGLLPQLLNILDTDESINVKIKALYAVSCLTRDVEESQKVFVENDGFSVLLRAMQTSEEKLQTKAAFMMRAMCISKPEFKEVLHNIGMVEQLAALLQTEHTSAHEHLMAALLLLVDGNTHAIEECQREELNLHNHLKSRKELLVDKEEFEEELEACEKLLKLLSTNTTSAVDR